MISREKRKEMYLRAIGGLLDRTEKLGEGCIDVGNTKSIWNYMDTASNVRDIARMSDLFDGEGAPM
jgi:hypothetical protein